GGDGRAGGRPGVGQRGLGEAGATAVVVAWRGVGVGGDADVVVGGGQAGVAGGRVKADLDLAPQVLRRGRLGTGDLRERQRGGGRRRLLDQVGGAGRDRDAERGAGGRGDHHGAGRPVDDLGLLAGPRVADGHGLGRARLDGGGGDDAALDLHVDLGSALDVDGAGGAPARRPGRGDAQGSVVVGRQRLVHRGGDGRGLLEVGLVAGGAAAEAGQAGDV